jgi:hypothetical protein
MDDKETRLESAWPGRWELAALCGLGLALVLTNPHFTFLDDEASIIYGAAHPAAKIFGSFLHSVGMHEHPPLYDLLFHGWLRLTGERLWALRIPSVIFYVFGIGVLALAGTEVAGKRAGRAVVWIAVLWPYGFHYGRLAAWYSFCFLLVGLATLAYLRVLRSPGTRNWIFLGGASLCLVWANYFGWAVVACLAVDYLLRRRSDPRLPLLPWLAIAAVLVVGYLPLVRAFWDVLVTRSTESGHSLVARILYGIYGLYALGVSESVAPWFWLLGIPAALATAVLLLTLAATRQPGRRFFVYFCSLFALMTLIGILTTKRLMLIAPWLLLPAAALVGSESPAPEAPTSGGRSRGRRFLLCSLAVTFAIGWFGILFPRHYAAPRFMEPWPQAAREAADTLSGGGIVIGNSPSFLLYLGYAIAARQDHELRPLEVLPHPDVYDPDAWIYMGHPLRPLVLLVKGVPVFGPSDPMEAAERWLDVHCRLASDWRALPDPGYRLKQRFLPQLGELPWRVETRSYACPISQ